MKNKTEQKNGPIEGIVLDPSRSRAFTIDCALYEKYLQDSDMNEEEKRQFLEALWNIIVGLVDLGFGVHPLQQVCEQELEIGILPSSRSSNVIGSASKSPKNTFSNVAKHSHDSCIERSTESRET